MVGKASGINGSDGYDLDRACLLAALTNSQQGGEP